MITAAPAAPTVRAVSDSSTTLSEAASKQLLAPFGVPFAAERLATTADEAAAAAAEIGFPVVAKLNGDRIATRPSAPWSDSTSARATRSATPQPTSWGVPRPPTARCRFSWPNRCAVSVS